MGVAIARGIDAGRTHIPTALSQVQFLGLLDSAGGLEEPWFQWSSPQTINPVGLETECRKLRAAHSNPVRRFHLGAGMGRSRAGGVFLGAAGRKDTLRYTSLIPD